MTCALRVESARRGLLGLLPSGRSPAEGQQEQAASALTGIPIALLSPVAGRLSDRFGQRRVFVSVLIGYLLVSFPVPYLLPKVDRRLEATR